MSSESISAENRNYNSEVIIAVPPIGFDPLDESEPPDPVIATEKVSG